MSRAADFVILNKIGHLSYLDFDIERARGAWQRRQLNAAREAIFA